MGLHGSSLCGLAGDVLERLGPELPGRVERERHEVNLGVLGRASRVAVV